MAKSLTLGKMTWVDENNYHDGAGKGRCSKAKIKTQLITAYEQSGEEWKRFEGKEESTQKQEKTQTLTSSSTNLERFR